MYKFLLLTALGLLAAAPPAAAGGPKESEVQACIRSAARDFGVPALHLQLLREVECGRVGHTSGNGNGSHDMGPMQINTIWLLLAV